MSTRERSTSFERRVDKWVRAAVDDGASNFDHLVSALPGVYPPVVASSLGRLRRDGSITSAQHRRVTRRAEDIEGRMDRPTPQILPAPHPLDYDWRYGPQAIDRLLEIVLRRSHPGDTVALLGTPSLYVAALRRHADRRFVLVDGSATTVDRLKGLGPYRSVLRRDLFIDNVPNLGATVVVADPPWYDDHIAAFLWAAAQCSREGSTVLVSLPGKGTRPGIGAERKLFRASASAHSLTVSRMLPGQLPYLSPPFEVNALAAAGWDGLPDDWRRGDLAILRAAGPPGPRPVREHKEHGWDERSLGWVRLRIRRGSRDHGVDPSLHSLVDGDVLNDVSRRHPLRDRPNAWTSGNRVYLCSSPHLLLTVIDALARGSDPSSEVASSIGRELTRVEGLSISKNVRQLGWLARLEGRELARSGWLGQPSLFEKTTS